MQKKPSTLSKSFNILHSSLLFIVTAYFLHIIFITAGQKTNIPLIFFIIVVAKVLLYSGFYGTAIELISNEQPGYTVKNFKKNIRDFWYVYFALSLLKWLIDAYSFSFFSNNFGISAKLGLINSDFIVVAILASVMISGKYLKPLRIKPRRINIRGNHILTLVALYFLDSFVKNINSFYALYTTPLDNFPVVLSMYIHILTFIYISTIIIESYPEISKQFNPDKELYMINFQGGGVFNGMVSQMNRRYPPVFVVLKALTPKNYKIREFNRIPWKERFYTGGKLVAITCYTTNCPEAYKVAKEFKKHGSKVVMGGPHVTYLPDEALDFCDSVVIGEAEGVWKEVVKDFENGTLKPKYNGPAIEDFHKEVHEELMSSPPEVIREFLETTRGCKYRCHFCTIPSLSGGRTRKKPIPEIVALINKIKHRYKTFVFIDNNIYSDPGYARELFKALIPLKIKWGTQCTIDIAKNEETLRLAKESGCKQFLFGYEIFGGSLEKQQGGKFALAEQYIKFTNKIKKIGIQVKAHFIYGFDSDNLKNAWVLWKFCFLIHPLYTVISLLTPLPGSKLYYDMLSENRISNYNWRHYDCHNLVYEHKQLNNSFLEVFFPALKYICFLTTSQLGQFIVLFIIFDYVFFGLKHM